MGIETRRNGRRYLYRKERTPSGVRSVYLGPADDPACICLAECARGRRIEADAVRRAHARTFDPIDAALGTLRQHAAALRTVARAYLVSAGYRTHRGQWRRARHLRPVVSALPSLTLPPDLMPRKKKPAPTSPATSDVDGYSLEGATGRWLTIPRDGTPRPALAAAVRACQTDNPTPADVSRLRDALADLPPSVWGTAYSGSVALRSAAQLLTGDTKPTAAVALAEAEAARFAADVAEDGGPLVRAAAAQVAAARLILDAVTNRYAASVSGSYNIDHAAAFERRMNAAQTRYLRALATVAALRRAEGSERERAVRLAAAAPPSAPDRRSLYANLPTPQDRVRERIARLAAAESGDSLPAPADLDLVTG